MMVYRPIDERIQRTLFRRIDGLLRENPDANLDDALSTQLNLEQPGNPMQEVLIKSCWARASVVLSGGNVVSLNTLLDENNNAINEPLNIKNGNPYRGKPGITNISSNYKEFFLKQSTLSFYVPDPDEFDTFKKQFLKFGRYMLIEFG